MNESMHVWDKIQALKDERKDLIKTYGLGYEVTDTILDLDAKIGALIPQLSKTDKKVLKIWQAQKDSKESNPQLSALLKIERYTLKLGKHIQHLQRLDERQDSHFHRLKSRVEHLSEMVADYDAKFRSDTKNLAE